MVFPILLLMLSGVDAVFPKASQTAIRAIDVNRVAADPTRGSSQITPGPTINNHILLGRDNFNTCGYVSGNAGKVTTILLSKIQT